MQVLPMIFSGPLKAMVKNKRLKRERRYGEKPLPEKPVEKTIMASFYKHIRLHKSKWNTPEAAACH